MFPFTGKKSCGAGKFFVFSAHRKLFAVNGTGTSPSITDALSNLFAYLYILYKLWGFLLARVSRAEAIECDKDD